MAYKNSDGNSSIANQWGQWRYFNSYLTKLGEYKATAPTIKPQKTIEEATQNGDVKQEVAQDSALESKTPSLSSFSEKIATTFGDTVEEDQARRSQDLSGFFEVQPSSMAGRGMNDGSF